jgi:peptide/nickel transport system ATP-binding protein
MTLLELDDVHVDYEHRRAGRWLRRRSPSGHPALDGVSLHVPAGSAIGIVGESGCGKSTLARVLMGLVVPDAGRVRVGHSEPVDRVARAKVVQMVFQDPGSSLNPALTIEQVLRELITVHGLRPGEDVRARCRELIDMVALPERFLGSRPSEMSGGQRQRAAIARALAVEPEALIADEAVASLDVSVQAGIINLLNDLRDRLALTLVFISHDIATVREVCDEVAVMYLGRIVERGPIDAVLGDPRHPYTEALLAAVPRLGDVGPAVRPAARGEVSSVPATLRGCRFRSRCPLAQPLCDEADPALSGPDAHRAACHFAWKSAHSVG